jgi:hypothetical protein
MPEIQEIRKNKRIPGLDIPVDLYSPLGTPIDQLSADFLKHESRLALAGSGMASARLNPAWVALAEIVRRINREPYHHMTGRVVFQKLAYFATRDGLPTGLRFSRNSYGPFAGELAKVSSRLINNGILREEKIGQGFEVTPGPSFKDAAGHLAPDIEQWEPIIDRVTDLFLRMGPREGETAGTVAFVADELRQLRGTKPTEMDVWNEVKCWKMKRKLPLNDADIASTIRNLALLRWLDVEPSTDLPVPAEDLLSV